MSQPSSEPTSVRAPAVSPSASQSGPEPGDSGTVRAVSRWQIVGLSINDVIGSGIYLLPATAAMLL
ncbi:hypothetical protein JTP67_30455, partial [Streptomyces sp. S12]|nr:hypothetical protein [Streptomyces sp. S12]